MNMLPISASKVKMIELVIGRVLYIQINKFSVMLCHSNHFLDTFGELKMFSKTVTSQSEVLCSTIKQPGSTSMENIFIIHNLICLENCTLR